MKQNKIFQLDSRVKEDGNYFDNIDVARDYDANIRTSMIVPMGKVTTKITGMCKKGDAILDIGCATGLLALRISGRNENVEITAVDNNDNLLQVAEENAALAANVNAFGMVEFKYAELEKLPFLDDSFDVVYSCSALHKWDNPEKVLKEIQRVCKKDGKVYLYDIARDADEGMISFVLQYIDAGQKDFIRELKASYTVKEVEQLLKNAGLGNWKVIADDVNLSVVKE